MRLIDADALKMDIIEAGQRSRRYRPWDLNRDEIWDVIDAQPALFIAGIMDSFSKQDIEDETGH